MLATFAYHKLDNSICESQRRSTWLTRRWRHHALPWRGNYTINWIKYPPVPTDRSLHYILPDFLLCHPPNMEHLVNEVTIYLFFIFTLGTLFRPSSERPLWKVDIGTRGGAPEDTGQKCVVNIASTFNFPSFLKLINNSVIERSDRGRYEVIVDGRTP